jgi:hypothetical protein
VLLCEGWRAAMDSSGYHPLLTLAPAPLTSETTSRLPGHICGVNMIHFGVHFRAGLA